ncbi:ABC transporter permease [Conexibacter sp. SYSU D00693]|uniref:MlaE family ABC transporter permease n=1 Tax=Conexibacter sp. SYSU D00693 TaxID=2812560 RepID=UPI00196B67A4|nr:ABC transporter permease [Conexibacter sp. SYSU D00693]
MAATAPDPQAAAPLAERPPARVGPRTSTLAEAGQMTSFAGQALRALPGSLTYVSEGMRQASLMMRGTLPLMFSMQLFQGFVVGTFGFFLLRGIGAGDFFGLVTGIVGPRQVAATMFGYVFAAKVCCGIAAELGAMKIQQEVDALESTGVDPQRYLVGTRLVGVLLFAPVAAVVSMMANVLGAYLIVVVLLDGLSGHTLMSLHWAVQGFGDTVFVIVTCTTIAVTTALVACFYGLRTTGGPAAVGASVARSLVVNLVVLHVIAAFFAVMVFGTDNNLPIGG